MLKWLARVVLAVVGLLVLAVLGVQLLRMSAYGDEQRAAVALAAAPPPAATGTNGYAALALSDHAVPAEAIDAEMAANVRDFSQWLDSQPQGMSPDSGAASAQVWTPAVASRYPAQPPVEYKSPLCAMKGDDCLALAKADTGAMRAFLASQSGRLALVEVSLGADHFHSPYPPSHQAPLPAYTALRLPLTQAAFDAVDGRVPDAMARTCRTLAGARRFTAVSRDLVGKMVFPSLAEGAARLLLELRREHPGVPLPSDCAPALAPVQADHYLMCEAMRGEFRMGAAMTARLDKALAADWTPRALVTRWLLMDGRLQDAWSAHTFAAPCTDDYRAQVLAGSVPDIPAMPVRRGEFHCYAAAVSCLLAEIAMPAYGGYQERLLDSAARLRVLLAAHSGVGGPVDEQALQSAAASPGYAVAVDAAARALSVRARFERGDKPADFRVAF